MQCAGGAADAASRGAGRGYGGAGCRGSRVAADTAAGEKRGAGFWSIAGNALDTAAKPARMKIKAGNDPEPSKQPDRPRRLRWTLKTQQVVGGRAWRRYGKRRRSESGSAGTVVTPMTGTGRKPLRRSSVSALTPADGMHTATSTRWTRESGKLKLGAALLVAGRQASVSQSTTVCVVSAPD